MMAKANASTCPNWANQPLIARLRSIVSTVKADPEYIEDESPTFQMIDACYELMKESAGRVVEVPESAPEHVRDLLKERERRQIGALELLELAFNDMPTTWAGFMNRGRCPVLTLACAAFQLLQDVDRTDRNIAGILDRSSAPSDREGAFRAYAATLSDGDLADVTVIALDEAATQAMILQLAIEAEIREGTLSVGAGAIHSKLREIRTLVGECHDR